MILTLSKNWFLIVQMSKREVIGRYQGSAAGLAWSFFNPVLMLGVYTFVFSQIFGSRWGENVSRIEFACILFAGLIVYALFSECLTRAPTLIRNNANYVKKVVFPLEILPIVAIGSSLFHALISIIVLLFFYLVIHGSLPWTIIMVPLVLFPLVVLTAGLSWLVASLGTYIRDIGQVIGIVMTAVLFLSPVLYPASTFPETYRVLFYLNPLTFIIEQMRSVLLWGDVPDWSGLIIYYSASAVVAWLGYAWFQKTRKGFADVL